MEIDARYRLRRQGDDRRVPEAERRDAGEQIRSDAVESLVGPYPAGDARPGTLAERAEHRRDVLERLALEQAGEQQVALLPQGELVVEVDVGRTRQQPAGLELDQRGGDEQELGGDVEVERLHPFDLGEVGVDDARQADLVEVHLLGQDELEQEVERTFVDRCLDTGRHRSLDATERRSSVGGWDLRSSVGCRVVAREFTSDDDLRGGHVPRHGPQRRRVPRGRSLGGAHARRAAGRRRALRLGPGAGRQRRRRRPADRSRARSPPSRAPLAAIRRPGRVAPRLRVHRGAVGVDRQRASARSRRSCASSASAASGRRRRRCAT